MTIKKINLMEVCGTHTMAIARFGLKKLFPKELTMLSGPGCPVCVTPEEDINLAIEISKRKDVIITTFGDMVKVPGTFSSLEKEKSNGADIRIIYSPIDALDIAAANPNKKIIFLGVGFETTSPSIAMTVKIAKKKKISNFYVLPMLKTIPNALEAILQTKNRKIDGFLLPGHVSAIIGAKAYKFIAEKYKIPCVIAGFEAKDILDSIKMLVDQIKNKKPKVEIQYSSVVNNEGNINAQKVLDDVFVENDSNWRGIGIIPKSGLKFKSEYKDFDASKIFQLEARYFKKQSGCDCGKILLGIKNPKQCFLFAKKCTPSNPIGPCMVSSEGACAAEYRYGRTLELEN